MQLFELFGVVKLDDQASKGLDQLDGKAEKSGGKFGKFVGTVGKGAAVLGAVAVATGVALFAMTNKVTQSFDNIAKTAPKLGISTDAYQEMDYWAGQNGLSTGNMEKAVGRLNQRIGAAANGNEKYSDALEALGINMGDVKDGTLSTEDAMYQSISALSKITNEQEKAALASELFGTKLGRELMPALQDGSLSLEDAAKKAKDLGIVIDGDVLASAEDFQDSWDDLTRSMGAFGQKVLGDMIPVFQLMMDWVIGKMPVIQKVFKSAFDVVADVIGVTIEWIGTIIDWFGKFYNKARDSLDGVSGVFEKFNPLFGTLRDAFQNFMDSIGPIWESLQTLFESLEPILIMLGALIGGVLVTAFGLAISVFTATIAAIGPLVNAILNIADIVVNMVNVVVALLTGDFAGAWEYLKKVGESTAKFFMNIFDTIVTFVSTFVNTIIDFFYGLYMTLVGNSIIPDMVNAIVKWFKNLGKWAIDLVKGMVTNVIKWFVNLYTGSVANFNKLRSSATTIFNAVKNAIMKPISEAKDKVISFAASLYTGAKDKFNNLKSSATSIFNSVKDVMVKPIEKARDLIGAAIDKVKSFFSGLKLKFPKISMPKLPSFKMSGKFGLNPLSVPKLGMNWNAMGGIASGPTIANTSKGLQGFGEVPGESEAFLPLNSKVLGDIGKGIADTMGGTNNDQPIVVEVHVTSVIDGDVAARSLEPAVTVIQNRKVKVRESFAT